MSIMCIDSIHGRFQPIKHRIQVRRFFRVGMIGIMWYLAFFLRRFFVYTKIEYFIDDRNKNI